MTDLFAGFRWQDGVDILMLAVVIFIPAFLSNQTFRSPKLAPISLSPSSSAR